jgi:hypothetical protein
MPTSEVHPYKSCSNISLVTSSSSTYGIDTRVSRKVSVSWLIALCAWDTHCSIHIIFSISPEARLPSLILRGFVCFNFVPQVSLLLSYLSVKICCCPAQPSKAKSLRQGNEDAVFKDKLDELQTTRTELVPSFVRIEEITFVSLLLYFSCSVFDKYYL